MNDLSKLEQAIFSMGCFWCGESAYVDPKTKENFPGIISIKSGYIGGSNVNPTYENHPRHKEAIEISYDPGIISYEYLLDIFWHNIDPFNQEGQFCDIGSSYTTAVFYTNALQHKSAIESKSRYEKILGNRIVTEILQASTFYLAEEYHQNYKSKNPIKYKYYQMNSGRNERLKDIWKKNN